MGQLLPFMSRLFDSVSKTFKPVTLSSQGFLSWYSCGPTVYDKTHLGHARNYVQVDIIQRLLESRFGPSTPIVHVMGVTDVDDKILKRAGESASTSKAISSTYEAEFLAAMQSLRVQPAWTYTRVTEHVSDIVKYIEHIEREGFAYKTSDGVYFDTNKLGNTYYSLRHDQELEVEPGGEGGKKHPSDFALWKSRQKGAEDLGWDSPWGFGRPGWHIECSAMIEAAFGPKLQRLDVHSGGIDLCFPHHNNEIAQTLARHGGRKSVEDLFGLFLHVGHLHIDGCKMSKSLKNFITVEEFFKSKGTADIFRMFCLLHHYRTNTNYSSVKIDDARNVLEKLCRFVEENKSVVKMGQPDHSDSLRWTDGDRNALELVMQTQQQIKNLIADDMHTAEAVHLLLQLTSNIRKYMDVFKDRPSLRVGLVVYRAVNLVYDFLKCCGIEQHTLVENIQNGDGDRADAAARAAVEIRLKLKQIASGAPPEQKNLLLKASDWARDEALTSAGIVVKDLPGNKSSWQWKK